MPFNELKRRDSFPPTILHLPTADTDKPLPSLPELLTNEQEEDDIDSNPISFFLTAPSDDFVGIDDEVDFFPEHEDFSDVYADVFDDDEDLSAGIEGSEEDLRSKEVAVREVSPSSLQRLRKDKDEGKDLASEAEAEVQYGFAMPLSLKDFTARPAAPISISNSSGRTSRAGQRTGPSIDEQLRGLGIELPEFGPPSSSVHRNGSAEKERGRGRVRLSPPTTARRSLSWSPNLNRRKPVSWRVPGRGIWRIDEVDEGDVGLSSSAPAGDSGFGIMRERKEQAERESKKKVVKRVHWADE